MTDLVSFSHSTSLYSTPLHSTHCIHSLPFSCLSSLPACMHHLQVFPRCSSPSRRSVGASESIGAFKAMQPVTCSTVSSQACCRTSGAESEHLSSSSSEVFRQQQEDGRGFCHGWSPLSVRGLKMSYGKGRAVTAAWPISGRAALGIGSSTGGGPLVTKERGSHARVLSSLITDPSGGSILSSEQKVYDVVAKQASVFQEQKKRGSSLVDVQPGRGSPVSPALLGDAYSRCGEVCAEHAKTFHLGTKLMTPERQRAIWAIYVWCRRTDELVDGPNASRITPTALDRWEERLEDIFRGQPYDMLDAALADTVAMFPVDIQPFRDMIDGMRMDLVKSRYSTFDELYLYCYNVAGTVGLMSVPVMGIAADSKATTETVYNAALALGVANQLTNILRDVGEDSRRRRVYLPQDELHQFGLSDEDIFAGVVTDKWRAFMKDQIGRARMFFDEAEKGAGELDKDSRWPVWASLILYRQILDSIEANDYNNFTKRAYVGKWKKLVLLPAAYGRALVAPPSTTPRLIGA